MPKKTWFMAILGFFLAAALSWGAPVWAQSQKGGLLNSSNKGSGTGSGGGFGYSGMSRKSESSSGDLFGSKNSDQKKDQAPEDQKTHTLAKPHNQPQSQTPGGTIIP